MNAKILWTTPHPPRLNTRLVWRIFIFYFISYLFGQWYKHETSDSQSPRRRNSRRWLCRRMRNSCPVNCQNPNTAIIIIITVIKLQYKISRRPPKTTQQNIIESEVYYLIFFFFFLPIVCVSIYLPEFCRKLMMSYCKIKKNKNLLYDDYYNIIAVESIFPTHENTLF